MPEGGSWLDGREQKAWRALLKGYTSLVAKLDSELTNEHELGLPDYAVLVTLSEAPQRALRMTELAKVVLLSPSGLTRRLDGLVKGGLVERRPCPSDGRGLLAVLTDTGLQRLQQAAPTHVRGVRQHLFDRLSSEQIDQLAAIFQTIDTSATEIHPERLGDPCGGPANKDLAETAAVR